MTISHRWSGWPGAFCLDCGSEDAVESALCCRNCDLTMPNDPPEKCDKFCEFHQAWVDALRTGCPPDKDAVMKVNALRKAEKSTEKGK